MFHTFIFILHGYITNSQYDQLPFGLIVQLAEHCIPGGVLGYKRDGGGGGGATEPNILHPKKYMDLILCTQKNTRLEILDPKKYMTFIPFRILRELWLELRKNY